MEVAGYGTAVAVESTGKVEVSRGAPLVKVKISWVESMLFWRWWRESGGAI
jgi:hypothetical protein